MAEGSFRGRWRTRNKRGNLVIPVPPPPPGWVPPAATGGEVPDTDPEPIPAPPPGDFDPGPTETGEPVAESDKREVLAGWWAGQASREIDDVVDKAEAYGGKGAAIDLLWIGHQMAANMGREVSDEEATELGIYYYALGKVARWTAAIREGRRVSDDTLQDLGVYARMAQRVRVAGGWPHGGPPKP